MQDEIADEVLYTLYTLTQMGIKGIILHRIRSGRRCRYGTEGYSGARSQIGARIAELPVGSITKRTVNGKTYFYHRWTENKKRREKYIPAADVDAIRTQIEQRKALEQKLRALRWQMPKEKMQDIAVFSTHIRLGGELRVFSASTRHYRKCACFQ